MHYYEVIPASKSYHGREPLTYCHGQKFNPGQIVKVSLRGSKCLGIIKKVTPKPIFETVEVEGILNDIVISPEHLALMDWMTSFYPAPIGTIAQLFAPSFLDKIDLSDSPSLDKKASKVSLPQLTKEQSDAYKAINLSSPKSQSSFIVYGITGSGKTRLYMELAKDALENGKSVLILTPEISLATPIANQFEKAFKNKVMINHSSLTQKKRIGIWNRVLSGKEPVIIIGPRSSLFMPIRNMGLIVVDEFHEPAYKQESQPFYHANRVASMLSKLSSSRLVFGSATPPIIDYFLAEQKNVPIIKMYKSAITEEKPSSDSLVVNLLDADERSSYPLISKTLMSHLSEVLSRKEQSMLFINRRGSARSVSCQDCGHKELCKNCDLPMVYHGDQHLLRCHTCGFKKQPPSKCPECGSLKIFFSSPGTKAIAESLSKMFPKAKILRFDKDNKKADRLENRYEEAVNDADIIVGTQVIAKGHDLPRLSLVAMLMADNGLDFPDFSSAERSYQLIKQLSGRINRGHRDGTLIVQTFNPSSKLIESAARGSWEEFYKDEIIQRKKYGFPPFYSALKVESSKKSRESAERSLSNLVDKLKGENKKLIILGPSPSFVEKKSSSWHWQVIIKAKNRSELINIAKVIPSSFKLDIDPNNFL